MILTPNIYATGKWQLKEPFSVPEDATFTCNSIRSFEELEIKNINIFEQYYEPFGLDESTYLADKAIYASIVTLSSRDHPTYYVPDTYILSYPDATPIPYNHMVLSISLGAIPDTLALDDIKNKIQQIVLSDLGNESVVKEHMSSDRPEYISVQDHAIIEAARMQLLESNNSLYTQVKQKDDRIQELSEQVALLQEYINQSN